MNRLTVVVNVSNVASHSHNEWFPRAEFHITNYCELISYIVLSLMAKFGHLSAYIKICWYNTKSMLPLHNLICGTLTKPDYLVRICMEYAATMCYWFLPSLTVLCSFFFSFVQAHSVCASIHKIYCYNWNKSIIMKNLGT